MRSHTWQPSAYLLLLALLSFFFFFTATDGVYVWMEGEGFTSASSSFQATYADPGLSAGLWEWSSGPRTFNWEITVPFPPSSMSATTTFNLYVRTQSGSTPFNFWFNNNAGQFCDSTSTIDSINLASNSGFYVSWVWAGQVVLTNPSPGSANATTSATLHINVTTSGAIDSLVLISDDENFAPRGQAMPDQLFNQTQAGYFPFQGRIDQFQSVTATDMSGLNENTAGDDGRIVVQGESFVHENTGKPVKFWAINVGNAHMDQNSIMYMAQQFKKMGINLVRYHNPIYNGNGARTWQVIDNTTLYDLFFLEHALKQHGIYLWLSIYWFAWVNLGGSASYPGSPTTPWDMLFFNTQLQNSYFNVWDTLLTTPNPYENGLTFAEDPAVAFASIMNEDSLLWYDLGSIPSGELNILNTGFGTYFKNKYGSLTAPLVAQKYPTTNVYELDVGDDLTSGELGLRSLWNACNQPDQRGYDTLDYLTGVMEMFYANTTHHLKSTLGYKGLVHGSNWMTICDAVNPLDKYANFPGDWLDRHNYYSNWQNGSDNGYSFSAGDCYVDQSALLFQTVFGNTGYPNTPNYGNPFNDILYNGFPSTISEVNWSAPNAYRADFPLTAAAYGSLQGTDGIFFFAASTIGWQVYDGKFSVQVPVIYTQMALGAYIYRNNLISEGNFVVTVANTYDNFVNLQMPPFANQNFTALRAAGVAAGANITDVTGIDPLAFYVGKVEVDINVGGSSWVTELSPYIDRTAQTVSSNTGQLNWDWKNGLIQVNAPAVQAVTGFLSTVGAVTLDDVTIDAGMDYGTVMVVAVDGNPIKTSSSIVVSIISENRNYNWTTSMNQPPVQRIQWVGSSPLMLKSFSGSVTFTSRMDMPQWTINALDENGYVIGSRNVTSGGQLTLEPTTLYYHISTPSSTSGASSTQPIGPSDLKVLLNDLF